MDQRRCFSCRKRFTLVRNPDQRYCMKSLCQKKRRSNYQQQKLKNDYDYRETHRTSQKKWRYKHPKYWQDYRLQHPQYVIRNQFLQSVRDRRRRHVQPKDGHEIVLANMYSLNRKNNYISNGYNVFLGTKTCLQICTL